jgi:FkbM family methyltransferase
MFDFAGSLTLPSALAYAAWRVRGRRGGVSLALKSGPRFELRSNASGNNDYGVAYEVFVHDYYDDWKRTPADRVKFVVDLGANVGYSLLYFLHKYPHCRILAFEAHPAHCAQAERNLLFDGTRQRVELYCKAAGAAPRAMGLTDRRSSSALVETTAPEAIAVEVVDIFPLLEGRRLDLLKIDIEGGEYEILGDPRFTDLDIGAIAMEWHSRGGGLDDKRWCEERLGSLGFTIEEIFTTPSCGMFWARRDA